MKHRLSGFNFPMSVSPMVVFAVIVALVGCASIDNAGQGELVRPQTALPSVASQNITLEATDNRAIDVRVFYPQIGCEKCPAIIFSHGAFSTYDRYDVLLTAWASNGYIVAAPLHVDSELHPNKDQYTQADALGLRIEDFTLTSQHFHTNADLEIDGLSTSSEIIAAGHSFGAIIAQVAGGAMLDPAAYTHDEIAGPAPLAIVALSPPGAIPNFLSKEGWHSISHPMFLITGTQDVLPGFVPEWELRLDSYNAAPSSLSIAAVFEGADHYFNGAFGRLSETDASVLRDIESLNSLILDFVQTARDGWTDEGKLRLANRDLVNVTIMMEQN